MNCASPRRWPSSLGMNYNTRLLFWYVIVKIYTLYYTPSCLAWKPAEGQPRLSQQQPYQGLLGVWLPLIRAAPRWNSAPPPPLWCSAFQTGVAIEPCWCLRHTAKEKMGFQMRLVSSLLLFFFPFILHALTNTKGECWKQHGPLLSLPSYAQKSP